MSEVQQPTPLSGGRTAPPEPPGRSGVAVSTPGTTTVGAYHWNKWDDVEAPLHYGYGAAAYYGAPWGDETEIQLRSEWMEPNPEQPWDDVRDSVRHDGLI